MNNKNSNLINTILEKKLAVVIVSPHQDDALLSCEALLDKLNGKAEITVVNAFTAAHKNSYTLSAKQFLKASGYTDASALYKEREEEDKKALSNFQCKIINLGLEDALFRRMKRKSFLGKIIPEFDHIYPTYRWHIIKAIAQNDPAIHNLKKQLEQFKNKKNIIFAPYGIGNHADHKLVRKVCEELFNNIVLYSDFPYNVRSDDYGKPMLNTFLYELKPNIKQKDMLLKMYKTQFKGLFTARKIPEHKEVYFVSNTL